MSEEVKKYAQGYCYDLIFNFDYSLMEITRHNIVMGEMRLANEICSFIKKEFFSNIHESYYKVHKINLGIIVFTGNENTINDIAIFFDKLKDNGILFDMAIKLSNSSSEHTQKQIQNILDKTYINYILDKDLDINLRTAIRKLKI
jgi:dihydroorotate dehydrogenase